MNLRQAVFTSALILVALIAAWAGSTGLGTIAFVLSCIVSDLRLSPQFGGPR